MNYQGRSDGGIWVCIPPKISPSGLYGVKMTPKRLLDMSIKFYTSQKILYPPPKKFWIRSCELHEVLTTFTNVFIILENTFTTKFSKLCFQS